MAAPCSAVNAVYKYALRFLVPVFLEHSCISCLYYSLSEVCLQLLAE